MSILIQTNKQYYITYEHNQIPSSSGGSIVLFRGRGPKIFVGIFLLKTDLQLFIQLGKGLVPKPIVLYLNLLYLHF